MTERPRRACLRAPIREDACSDADSEESWDNDPCFSQLGDDDDDDDEEFRPPCRSSSSKRKPSPTPDLSVPQARTSSISSYHSSEGYEEGVLGEGEGVMLGPSQERARERQRQIYERIDERLAAHEDVFWPERMRAIVRMTPECVITNTRRPPLPPARIKKYVKEETSMNFAPEVTHFMVVACELLIMDLTTRAWACAEESKRKGVQRCDIARGISVSDTFDFLIDIVPREYMHIKSKRGLRSMVPYLIPIHGEPNDAGMSFNQLMQSSGVPSSDEYGMSGLAYSGPAVPPARPGSAMSQHSQGEEADGLFLTGDDLDDDDISCLEDVIILSQNHRPGPFRAHPSGDAPRGHVRAPPPERKTAYDADMLWMDKARGRHPGHMGAEGTGGIFDDDDGGEQGGFVVLGGAHV